MHQDEIAPLTGIRFLAAFAVLFAHAVASFFGGDNGNALAVVTSLSSPAMTLFFVLSGFVLQYRYGPTIGKPGGVRDFFVARFARLYPLYIVLLLVGIPTFAALRVSQSTLHQILSGLPFFVFGIQSWVPLWVDDLPLIYTNYFALSWSISTEFFFYLLFPLLSPLVAILVRGPTKVLAAAALTLTMPLVVPVLVSNDVFHAVEAMTPAKYGFHWWFQYVSPYARIFEFVAGVAIGQLYCRDADRPTSAVERLLAQAALYAALAAFVLLHWSLWTSERIGIEIDVALMQGVLWYVVPLSGILYLSARYGLVRLLSQPWMLALGGASYSIYLAHPLIIELTKVPYRAAARWLFEPDDPILTAFRWALFAGCLLGVPVLSIIIHRRFEMPARVAAKQLLTRAPIVRERAGSS